MREDATFSEKKLTEEEFDKKYWKGAKEEFIYQYHTVSVMDGRDEREQLIINNIRALFNNITELHKHMGKNAIEIYEIKKAVRRKRNLQLVNHLVIMGVILLWILKN